MPTLLLSARQSEDAQALWRACIGTNWKVERVHGWQVPMLPPAEVALYGEPLFGRHVAQTLGLNLLEPKVDWLARLSNKWRGREVRFTTLGAARKIVERAFIKPADEKYFDAKVYRSGAELPQVGPLPEELPVLVQEVVEWEMEFRCFILEGKVLTLSPYWRDGGLAQRADGSWLTSGSEYNEARRFCAAFLDDPAVEIPAAVVVDVGVIRGRGWAVIESNAAWASGIYGCEPTQVLRVLRGACLPSGTGLRKEKENGD